MVDRNDLALMFSGHDPSRQLKIPPRPDLTHVLPSKAIEEGAQQLFGDRFGELLSTGLGYVPWLGKAIGWADEFTKTPEERLADLSITPAGPTDVNAPTAAVVSHGGGAPAAAPGVGGRDELAKVKKLTKAEREKLERLQATNQVITSRGLTAGENKMPLTNPSEEELAAIRAERGGGLPGEKGTEENINTEGVRELFPSPSQRTREQRPLDRTVRAEMTPRVAALVSNPAARAAIKAAAEKGRSARGWYDTTPLQQKFHEILGPEEGQKAFEDYIGYVAATSSDNKLGSNIRTGSYYYANERSGARRPGDEPLVRKQDVISQTGGEGVKGLPKEGIDVPGYETPASPYGHVKQQTHMHNANTFGRDRRFPSQGNPKIEAFRENLLGNWAPTTVDKHAMRLAAMATRDPRWLSDTGRDKFEKMIQSGVSQEEAIDALLKGEGKAGAGPNWAEIADSGTGEYAAVEKMWNEVADEIGVTPAELQAMAWIGGGDETGLGSSGTFMDSFMDRVRRSSIQYNIPPEQVIELMIRGKLTLAQLEPGADAQGTSAIG